jgi:hypothetical protein
VEGVEDGWEMPGSFRSGGATQGRMLVLKRDTSNRSWRREESHSAQAASVMIGQDYGGTWKEHGRSSRHMVTWLCLLYCTWYLQILCASSYTRYLGTRYYSRGFEEHY